MLSIRLGISESSNSKNKNSIIANSTNTTITTNTNHTTSDNLALKIIKILILCITIIVVAIPEGLPLAVTLSLSFSISKMMEDNNLVRKMQACETMGGANFICSDKTGTLTKNIMTVNIIFDGCQSLDMSSIDDKQCSSIFTKDYLQLLKEAIILNLNIEFDEQKNMIIPSKTDNALALFLLAIKENVMELRKLYFPDVKTEIKFFPFNSDRKKMSTIITNDSFPLKNRIYLKGASEIVLGSCLNYYDQKTLSVQKITDIQKGNFSDVIKNFASRSLRTLCLAYKDISQEECNKWEEKDLNGNNIIEENEFTLIGIVGIKDSLRDGVKEAVSKCETAGITVVMVTGDNIDTAIAIAKDCQIIKANEDESKSALLGSTFMQSIGSLMCDTCKMDDLKCHCPKTIAEAKRLNLDTEKLRKDKIKDIKKFEEITKSLRVLARSRPEDKFALVLGLKELGNIVAITGDGTNDAPALSKADVGFSMGIQGTDIANNASDIIILDDNFNSIVKAILWGRIIYDNIKKFIKFQLTVNICAVVLVFACVCVGNETPLTTIQMLWVNMIMDSLGSLGLATEAPYDDLLLRKPHSREEYMITNLMLKHILIQSIFLFSIFMILYLNGFNFIIENDSSRLQQAQY